MLLEYYMSKIERTEPEWGHGLRYAELICCTGIESGAADWMSPLSCFESSEGVDA